MIRALIVEDERPIRNGLARHIHWQEIGVDEVRTAASGEEAEEIMKECRPDLLLTDIRMSGMDGTELARRTREKFPDTQIIFITGYTDKEYLQSAIAVGAAGYVEKPVDPQELTDLVKKALQTAARLRKVRQISIHSLLNGPLQGTDVNPALWLHYAFLLVRPRTGEIRDFEQLAQELEQKISTGLGDVCATAHDRSSRLYYSFWVSRNSAWREGELRNLAEMVLEFFIQNHEECFVSCSNEGRGTEKIRSAYAEAEEAQKNLSWKDWNSCSDPSDPGENVKAVLQEDEINPFRSMIGNHQREAAAAFVHSWADRLISRHAFLNIYTRNIFYDMDRVIVHFGARNGSWPAEFDGQNDITLCRTFRELENHVLVRIDYAMGTSMTSPSNQQIDAVCLYIRNHLQDQDLSTASLAQVAGLSPSYLSSLFSQTRNVTISQYITDCRIRKAKELLKDPRYRLYEIAEMVGYEDAKYFSRQFRKVTGVSPREFRNSL